jgi:hypothetical protein
MAFLTWQSTEERDGIELVIADRANLESQQFGFPVTRFQNANELTHERITRVVLGWFGKRGTFLVPFLFFLTSEVPTRKDEGENEAKQ